MDYMLHCLRLVNPAPTIMTVDLSIKILEDLLTFFVFSSSHNFSLTAEQRRLLDQPSHLLVSYFAETTPAAEMISFASAEVM